MYIFFKHLPQRPHVHPVPQTHCPQEQLPNDYNISGKTTEDNFVTLSSPQHRMNIAGTHIINRRNGHYSSTQCQMSSRRLAAKYHPLSLGPHSLSHAFFGPPTAVTEGIHCN